jgi:hypothetical protein
MAVCVLVCIIDIANRVSQMAFLLYVITVYHTIVPTHKFRILEGITPSNFSERTISECHCKNVLRIFCDKMDNRYNNTVLRPGAPPDQQMGYWKRFDWFVTLPSLLFYPFSDTINIS